MSFADYIKSPEGIATIRAALGSGGVPATRVRNTTELKAKWAKIGNIPHGTTDSICINTPGFDPAVVLPVTYSAVSNGWYSQPVPIYWFNLPAGRATTANAAVGTTVTTGTEGYCLTNFQSYVDVGLTAQMSMYAVGSTNNASAFPICRFRCVRTTTNPQNVSGATPANLIQLNLSTGAFTSSGISGWADYTVTGTGAHLWGDGVFEVGGVAATITGYVQRVDLRWKV